MFSVGMLAINFSVFICYTHHGDGMLIGFFVMQSEVSIVYARDTCNKNVDSCWVFLKVYKLQVHCLPLDCLVKHKLGYMYL